MKITAGINFAKSKMKWSNVSLHNDRKYNMAHDRNKNIDTRFSKYNRYGHLLNYYRLMAPYIDKSKLKKKHQRYLNHRQKARAKRYASVKAYLRSKHRQNTRCGVITIGNSKIRAELESSARHFGHSVSECRQFEAQSLYDYISHFNDYHKYIKINHYAIHSDEKFIHAHAEFVGAGAKTKSGKTSFNFNKALEREEGTSNNKKALKKFRAQEDPIIARSMGEGSFQLTRTGQATSDTQAQHSRAVSESSVADDYSDRADDYSHNASSYGSKLASEQSEYSQIKSKVANAKAVISQADVKQSQIASADSLNIETMIAIGNRQGIRSAATIYDYKSGYIKGIGTSSEVMIHGGVPALVDFVGLYMQSAGSTYKGWQSASSVVSSLADNYSSSSSEPTTPPNSGYTPDDDGLDL